MQDYPKALYHPTKEPVKVLTVAQHQALGDGWYDTPTAAKAAAGSVVTQSLTHVHNDEERDRLQAQAQYDAAIGPLVDKLAGVKSREVLEKARAFELKNPRTDGPRKRVLGAIDDALAKLPA